ncbi:MAG: hypothetical protein MRZ79_19325 [Bacteroidia bacterium]|nr:hypothetical protein [Bacteroidia bacterium]
MNSNKTNLSKALQYLLILVVPILFISFENQLIHWLYQEENGILSSKYYTLSFFILITGGYFFLGRYIGRQEKK